jgi:hypothetical protein
MWHVVDRGHRCDDVGAGNDSRIGTSFDDDDIATRPSGSGSAGHPRAARMDEGG